MESGSQAENPPGRSSQKLADIIGTAIALLTLTLPLVAIAHFSTVNVDLLPPTPAYPLSQSSDQ
jgi:hypothetical protein